MKKIFTLAAAMLLSVGMFAVDPVGIADTTVHVGSITNPGAVKRFNKYCDGLYLYRAANGSHSYSAGDADNKGIKIQNTQSGLAFYIEDAQHVYAILDYNATNSFPTPNVKLFKLNADKYGEMVNGTNNSTTVEFASTDTVLQNTLSLTFTAKGVDTLKFEDVPAGCYYIYGTTTSSNTYFCRIKFEAACKAPTEALAVSVQESDPIYEGDVVHFNVTGGNGGSPKLLLDGASYSDYAWGAEKGEHTFTVIQDKVGEYCAQEAEVKFTVLEKVPVASVVISGPDKGYVGHEITLTATAEGATEWRWMDSENSPIAGADKATYTFTPDHAGTWKFNCQARNEFNGETAGVKNWKSSEIKSIEVVVPETKIYSLNAGIGAAEKTADNATAGDQLVLSNSAGRIKLTPKSGETFKAGDKVNIGGTVGMANKEFGVIVYAANGSTKLAEVGVAVGEAPLWATIEATLNADAEFIFLARKGATTTTIYSCEISRDGVESSATAAGLAYDAASVSKAANDAAFINPLTNPNGLVVYYASSDVAVATVDPLSGEVTPKAEGSATISAHCGLQLKSDSYFAAGSASYALTVSAATGIENSEAVVKAVKTMENGQLIIIKNGVKYNAQGAIVK